MFIHEDSWRKQCCVWLWTITGFFLSYSCWTVASVKFFSASSDVKQSQFKICYKLTALATCSLLKTGRDGVSGKTITCFVSGAGELWLSILICLGQHKLQTDLFSFHGLSTRGSHGCLLLPWIWVSSTTQTAFWGNGEVLVWFLLQIDFDHWCVMVDVLGETYPSLLSFSKSLQSSN